MNPEDDPSMLIGLAGMTVEQFADQAFTLDHAFETQLEDDLPGSIVLRVDYDTIFAALEDRNPELALLAQENRLITDAMGYLVHAARIYARHHHTNSLTLTQQLATDATLIFRIAGA